MESLDSFVIAEPVVDLDQQRLDEWIAQRAGKLTCSKFDLIMKSGRSDPFSVTAYTYLREVLAERIGSWSFNASSQSMTWGTENEAAAVECFRGLFTGASVDYDSKRFVEMSEWVGGSPDGLIDDDACLEIKCPYNPAVHVQTLLNQAIPEEYYWQCVGHCLVTGRDRTYFASFDPRLPDESPNRMCVVVLDVTQEMKQELNTKLSEAVEWLIFQMARLGVSP